MIQSDSLGFLVGNERLKQISEGVNKTEDNTDKILKFLQGEAQKLIEAQSKNTESIQNALESMLSRQKQAKNSDSSPSSTHRASLDASAGNSSNTANQEQIPQMAQNADSTPTNNRRPRSQDATDPNINLGRRSRRNRSPSSAENTANDSQNPSSAEERAVEERKNRNDRERDSNGRFTAKEKTLFSKIKDFITGGRGGASVDSKGVDPTVDALNELKEFVSPVSHVFGRMSAKATGIFTGRLRKQADTLPEEQSQANRRDHDSSLERNRLLKKLIDAIRANNNGGGGIGGFFGGLFKKGGGLLKGLIKKLPLIGGLIGGGLLAKDWDKLDIGGKGEGVGSIVGGIVGAAVGSFFSPVGTVVGGGLGVYLGGIFGKKVAEWTNGLKNINFIGVFVELWEKALAKITDFAKSVIKNPIQAGKDAYNGAKNFGSRVYDGAVNMAKDVGNTVSGWFGGGSSETQPSSNAGLKHESTAVLGKYKQVADAISVYESKGSYTIANTGGYEKRRVKGDFQTKEVADLTNMSINDILKRNALPVGHDDRLNAVGRYQIIASNLRNWVNSGQLDGNAKFTPELQDKLFLKLMPKAVKDYADGKGGSAREAQNAAAQVWAAVPNADTGRSAFEKVGLNKAHSGAGSILQTALENTRKGIAPSNQAPTITPASATTVAPKQATPKGSKALADFANNAPMPSHIKAQVVTPFRLDANRSNPMMVKVPSVQPEMTAVTPYKPSHTITTQPQQDSMIAQDVSDRGLAHIITGGIGFRSA